MGFNTVAFMLNDCCHDIEGDPRLSQVLRRAMASGMGSDEEVPGLTILPSHHADYNHLVLAGGNRIQQIASFGRGVEYSKEGVMRALAAELGFTVSRDSGSARNGEDPQGLRAKQRRAALRRQGIARTL